MKLLPLSRGLFAQVDDEDYEWLNQWKWSIYDTRGKTFYAKRLVYINGKQTTLKLHRVILGLIDPKCHVDHKDGNGLNNQRNNIRIATRSENNTNRHGWGSSIHAGVHLDKQYNRWRAYIQKDNKHVHLGSFGSEIAAAEAYNKAAIKLHGEFAKLNIIPQSPI